MNNRRLKRRSTVTFLQLLARSSVFEPPRAARSCSDRPPPPPPPPSLQHHLLQKMPRLLLQGGFGDWSSAIIWARFCQTRVKGTRHRVPARSSARGHCSRCCCYSLNIIFFGVFVVIFVCFQWTGMNDRRHTAHTRLRFFLSLCAPAARWRHAGRQMRRSGSSIYNFFPPANTTEPAGTLF